MSWVEEVIELLAPGAEGTPAPGALPNDRVSDLARRLEAGLQRARSLEDIQELLAAESLLHRLAAAGGELFLTDASRALEAMERPESEGAEVSVLGVGEAGHALIGVLAGLGDRPIGARRLFLDTETSRRRDLDPETIPVVLEGFPATETGPVPRYGDILRASYRASAGPRGLPPLIAEALEMARGGRVTAHVVVGIEDPWLALIPDLLFDLRTFLDWGRRGSSVLHLVTRPSPRLRGSFLEALEEIERTRPFDEAFIVISSAQLPVRKVAAFVDSSARVPQLFLPPAEAHRRGAFSSYGTSEVPAPRGESAADYLSRLDAAFRAASPSWTPANVVLSELAPESVFLLYPPDSPPDEQVWKLCPEVVPVPLEGVRSSLWRVQRGLGLKDLRLIS